MQHWGALWRGRGKGGSDKATFAKDSLLVSADIGAVAISKIYRLRLVPVLVPVPEKSVEPAQDRR